ncbi:TniQ family protein [Rhizobium sp. NFACC06-2]|uniref:TniQ family protein n=1 Tax=Rhizobium sp. NFACC06-2 TaxID=1566264 RepID=UPI000877332C|nr:TniQ family protein [Rhizobium sp. NFACC06-2]SCY59053.1 TniQ protein [Rhizobium sp. NFACC06-2]
MSNSGRLPYVVLPFDDETAESFVARLVWANGFHSLAEFCDFTGTRQAGIIAMDRDELAAITRWSGVSEARLQAFAIRRDGIVAFGSAQVKRTQLRATHRRYCPHCFSDDIRNGTGHPRTRIYMRATWRLSVISRCSRHGVPLVDLPEDFDTLDLKALTDINVKDAVASGALPHDRYFSERLLEPPATSYLDTLPLYVGAELCAVLGGLHHFAAEGKISDRVPGGMTNPECLASGYAIAAEGREAVWDFLTSYIVKMVGKASKYPMVYSLPLRWLRDEVPGGDYGSIRELFQDHAEKHLPLEQGETFLTVVSRRRVHTVYSAAKEYGLPEARVRDVVINQGGGNAVIAVFGSRSVVFRKDEAHGSLIEAASQLTTTQAAERLGCAMTQMEALLNEGYLPFTTNGEAMGRVYRWVSADEVQRFRDRVKARLSLIPTEHNLVPVLDATKICHRTFIEIIALILDGKLAHVQMSAPDFRLDKIMVNPTEIDELSASWFGGEFLDRASAAAALGTRRETINDLFDLGIVPTMTVPHRKIRSQILVVRSDDLERFSQDHVLLDVLAKERGEAAIVVRRQLEKLGTYPVYETSRKATKIYRRSDIERVGL